MTNELRVTHFVNAADLEPGDIIVGCKVRTGFVDWPDTLVLSTSMLDTTRSGPAYYKFTYRAGSGAVMQDSGRPLTVTFGVIRTGRSVSAEPEPPKKRVIDEYPGTCAWCGGIAYVSALSVLHRSEAMAAAVGCPARRA